MSKLASYDQHQNQNNQLKSYYLSELRLHNQHTMECKSLVMSIEQHSKTTQSCTQNEINFMQYRVKVMVVCICWVIQKRAAIQRKRSRRKKMDFIRKKTAQDNAPNKQN